jgi:DNA-binding beta-propeller fold protein YncE
MFMKYEKSVKLGNRLIYCLFVGFLLLSVFLPQSAHADLTYSFKFGTSGTDNDEFQDPSGIAISNDGQSLYVADSNNNRIIVVQEDGDYDFDFGSFCNMSSTQGCDNNAPGASEDGDGQFNEPLNVAVDEFGDIFVVDSQNDRIQRFDNDGDFEIKFGSSDSNDQDYLGTPAGIAIQESTRNSFVTSKALDAIVVFDSSGNFEFKFGSTGSGEGEFRNPSHLLIDNSKDMLYVADTDNDRIQMFELTNGSNCPGGTTEIVNDEVCFVDEFGSVGSDDGEFNSPSGLELDHANDLFYVADTKNNRIQIFELVDGTTCPQGTTEIIDGVCFVEEFGSTGSSNGKFDSPSGLALDFVNDMLYVTDTNNDRVQVFEITTSNNQKPEKPTDVSASAASPDSIILTWKAPVLDEGVPEITGYKIEFHVEAESFSTLVANTNNPNTSFLHEGLDDNETYTYRVYAINSAGTSSASSESFAQPQITTVPAGLIATAISPNQIFLSWNPPSETFGQTVSGYLIEREVIPGVYDTVAEPSGSSTTYTVSNLQTDKTYTFVVSAKYPLGASDVSNPASATPRSDSKPLTQYDISSPPTSLTVTAISPIQIDLAWNYPSDDGGVSISGYRIDVKSGTGNFVTLVQNTDSTIRTYSHPDRVTDTTYTYKVYAINAAGTSSASNEASATPTSTSGQTPPEEKPGPPRSLLATAISATQINLSWLEPSDDGGTSITGYKIEVKEGTGDYTTLSSNAGKTTSYSHTGIKPNTNYQYQVYAINSIGTSTLSISASVTTPALSEPEPVSNVPDFIDPKKGSQYYLDRYNNEVSYKAWFDSNFPDYTIQEAIELAIPGSFTEETEKPILPFVDPNQNPQYYIDRYNNEESYKEWFDENFPDYTIEEAVGIKVEKPKEQPQGICGAGTKWIDGTCEAIKQPGGGCLIATATYGSELSVEVQQLRELRDNALLQTSSGSTFMIGFNQFYYSFSPTIADWERQNHVFKEIVHLAITPLISSLSILNYVDIDSEEEVLGYGIGLILLNLGMYFGAPVGIGIILVRKIHS